MVSNLLLRKLSIVDSVKSNSKKNVIVTIKAYNTTVMILRENIVKSQIAKGSILLELIFKLKLIPDPEPLDFHKTNDYADFISAFNFSIESQLIDSKLARLYSSNEDQILTIIETSLLSLKEFKNLVEHIAFNDCSEPIEIQFWELVMAYNTSIQFLEEQFIELQEINFISDREYLKLLEKEFSKFKLISQPTVLECSDFQLLCRKYWRDVFDES